ncbi:MAG: metal-dependent transcriptional regulator, partial [Aliifodinibius sp.]|nr:metal-dependent transcriptional regulator [Fodinibius sp.]
YRKHRGVILTDKGRKIALEILRHHRLLELFLHEVLDYPWDEVDEEADRLEHVISEKFEDRIAKALGNPEYDPHGDPIPTKDLTIPSTTSIPLSSLRPGQDATIKRVKDDDSDLLKHLQQIGIIPETQIEILEFSEFDGNLHIKIEKSDQTEVLGPKITNQIFVEVHE